MHNNKKDIEDGRNLMNVFVIIRSVLHIQITPSISCQSITQDDTDTRPESKIHIVYSIKDNSFLARHENLIKNVQLFF